MIELLLVVAPEPLELGVAVLVLLDGELGEASRGFEDVVVARCADGRYRLRIAGRGAARDDLTVDRGDEAGAEVVADERAKLIELAGGERGDVQRDGPLLAGRTMGPEDGDAVASLRLGCRCHRIIVADGDARG
ncbi:MAG: hypothetical protein IPK80_07280 [Nannocystis sp.]|nr:hypothetical protein [Nannocystis sp.]